jgi:antitoxin (DNA-binding transcriptional repressor) of toxin-antitoxin stability system
VTERRGEPGPIVERALETLRALPATDNEAVARIVAAAARTRAQDAAPNDDDLLPLTAPPRPALWPLGVAAAAVFIALGVALVARQARSDRVSTTATADSTAYIPASAPATDAAPVPTQFVYDGPARRVVLVGDFNNWDEQATPLEREPGSALWSVTVPIQRGRHIYAFLVDSVWTVDKRAPVASDPDFGVTGSVILVGRP